MCLRILTIFLFLCSHVAAATYFISPNGNDTTGDGSTGSPWKTFAYSFGEMSASDELVLKDGTYSLANDTGAITFDNSGQGESGQPPSGTSTSAMTIVRAENLGGAVVDGTGEYTNTALFVGRTARKDSYIKIQGIKFLTGAAIFNGRYCYMKNCGVTGGRLSIGSADHATDCDHNLIEDCWVWSDGQRIVAQSYKANYTIWRRVVLRDDGGSCPSSGPEVGLTIYNSNYNLIQNVISIDRLVVGSDGCYGYADFATAQHDNDTDFYLVGNQWLGCMVVNSEDTGFYFEGDNLTSPSHVLKNCITAGTSGASFDFNIQGDGTSVENSVAFRDDVDDGSGSTDEGSYFYSVNSLDYIVGVNKARRGIDSGSITVPYATLTGTYTIEETNNATITNKRTTDPTNDGDPDSIVYPVRLESGSALDTAGYGFSIEKKIGTTGAFYGDTGYNTVTSDDLWPWPNEDQIKTDMSEASTRGFCATGETLTKYIWEYLGNEIPSDIYGEPATINCSGTANFR